MKKHFRKTVPLIAFALLLLSKTMVAQSVSISGPTMVETGVSSNFTATVNLPPNSHIQRYEWTAFTSSGPQIPGSINGILYVSNVVVPSNAATNTAAIVWGDGNSFVDQTVDVLVSYRDGDDVPMEVQATTFNVKVRRIGTFFVLGPTLVQQCCPDTLTYYASGYEDGVNSTGYAFSWTWPSGWIPVGSTTSSSIKLVPNSTGGGTVSCTIRRSAAPPAYFRTNAVTVTRFQPMTPAIQSSDYFCIGENYEICVPKICGMTGVIWNVPPSLQIVSQGENCITVTPGPTVPPGSTDVITAQVVMAGGCTATVSQRNFTIYIAETPPLPQGYITLDLEEGSDPCNDPIYLVHFHTNTPYQNGITRVSPGIILGKRKEPILISVCNINLCSGLRSCIYFWVDPPYPCIEIGGSDDGKIAERSRNGSPGLASEDIVVSPNPTPGDFHCSCRPNFPAELHCSTLPAKLYCKSNSNPYSD